MPDATWFYFGMEFLKSSLPERDAQWQPDTASAVLLITVQSCHVIPGLVLKCNVLLLNFVYRCHVSHMD